MRDESRRVHFVGIGGAGMSALAELLLAQGSPVSGSDLAGSVATERLSSLGAQVRLGHAAGHVRGCDLVVSSSAVRADNPELVEAERLGIPVIPRAEMLAELMRGKQAVAVAGSHGKTTTSAMIAAVMLEAGLDPTVAIGGRLAGLASGARFGRGRHMVVEADESDRSFLRLRPALAVVTNVDREHLDAYRGLEDLQEAFVQFANGVPPEGAAVVCLDDAPAHALLARIERRVLGYGLLPSAQARAAGVTLVGAEGVTLQAASSAFTAFSAGEPLGPVELSVPGAHNVLNALAALAACLELGVAFERIREGLRGFRGALRRFEWKGEAGGVAVIDDYGHHPTEIRATLRALKAFAGPRRCVVLFQPHRYTRTRALLPEFADAFGDADELLLADVYPAGEPELEGADSRRLAGAIAERGRPRPLYAGDLLCAAERLSALVEPGDVVLTLGAGDVHQAGELLLRRRGGGA